MHYFSMQKIKSLLPIAIFFKLIFFDVSSCFGDVEFTYQQFSRINQPETNKSTNQWVNFHFDNKKKFSYVDTKVNFDIRSSSFKSADHLMYSFGEFFAQTNQSNILSFAVGRKILDWNTLGANWGISLLNPQRGFNLLENDEEGLLGTLFNGRFGKLSFSFFGSYIYIPQLNPPQKIEKGKVVTANEWARTPHKNILYHGNLRPVYYVLHEPSMSDIVKRPAFGGRFLGDFSYFNISFYYLFKGDNSAKMEANGRYILKKGKESGYAKVDVYPKVINHHLFGASSKVKLNKYFSVSVSYDESIPKDNVLNSKGERFYRFAQTIYSEKYFTANTTYKNEKLDLRLNYLYLINQNEIENDIFRAVPRWYDAIGFYGSYKIFRRVKLTGEFRQDFSTKDVTIRTAADFLANKNTAITLGAEFVQSINDTFWSNYKNNDSIYVNAKLIF